MVMGHLDKRNKMASLAKFGGQNGTEVVKLHNSGGLKETPGGE